MVRCMCWSLGNPIERIRVSVALIHELPCLHPARLLVPPEQRAVSSSSLRHMLIGHLCFPLQVLKRQGYDAACDIWSLGILLYTMLAG